MAFKPNYRFERAERDRLRVPAERCQRGFRILALLGCRIARLSDAARLSSDHSDGRFYSGGRPALFPLGRGGPERSNGTVSKSVSVPWGTDGSNPCFLQQGVRCEPDFRGRIPSMAVGDFSCVIGADPIAAIDPEVCSVARHRSTRSWSFTFLRPFGCISFGSLVALRAALSAQMQDRLIKCLTAAGVSKPV